MKTVCYCDSVFEAEIIRGRLEDGGIPSCVINDNIHCLIPVSSVIQNMSVQVVVDEQNFVQARSLLNESDYPLSDEAMTDEELTDNLYVRNMEPRQDPASAEGDRSVTLCPQCGSDDVTYGFLKSKHGIKKAAIMIMLPIIALMGHMLGDVRNSYYCKKCCYEFKPPRRL